MSALRSKFGGDNLVTAAITADASAGGKIDAADYAGAAQYVDWYNPMTYDYFGAWDAKGPTAPHSPLTSYNGIPKAGFNTDATIKKLKGLGVPAEKLLLGIGFYGRGWTGVTQKEPGGTATGPAAGQVRGRASRTTRCSRPSARPTARSAGPRTRTAATNWWSYDTPATIAREDGLQEPAGPGRHLLLGAERRHVERRADQGHQLTLPHTGDGAGAGRLPPLFCRGVGGRSGASRLGGGGEGRLELLDDAAACPRGCARGARRPSRASARGRPIQSSVTPSTLHSQPSSAVRASSRDVAAAVRALRRSPRSAPRARRPVWPAPRRRSRRRR